MKLKFSLIAVLGGAALLLALGGDAALAGEQKKGSVVTQGSMEQLKHKKRTRVYGYSARRGGYSYTPSDVINTYGLTRNQFGSTNSYRDFWIDRQTRNGPFDHGFFFDSANSPRGGDSPYLH